MVAIVVLPIRQCSRVCTREAGLRGSVASPVGKMTVKEYDTKGESEPSTYADEGFLSCDLEIANYRLCPPRSTPSSPPADSKNVSYAAKRCLANS